MSARRSIREQIPWWLLGFGVWTLLGLAFATQLYLARQEVNDPVTWGFALKRAFADWYVFAALSLPALWLAKVFPVVRRQWQANLVIHLCAAVVFSLAYMAVRAVIEQWLTRNDLVPVTFSAAFSRALVATFVFNVLIYGFIVIVSHAAHSYRELHRRDVQTAELETRLAQARLQALQMQLNPHFLFNTLNTISSLMHKDVEAADRMLTRLSDLLRYALESTDEQEVPLRQELDFLDRYLEIQQARFGDRLVIEREIDSAALDAQVPNLLLQPIVENAICHGIAPHARPGRIVLRARHRDGQLLLEVEDNGGGLPDDEPLVEGIGLANTRARLQQLYGSAHEFLLVNAMPGGLLVKVTIPWKELRPAKAPRTELETAPTAVLPSTRL